jgi:hypothetical protein
MRASERGKAMKRMLVVILAIAGLLLLPAAGYPQANGETVATAPPVAQPLVREGSFAMELVKALNMGTAQNEADAESLLASAGIAPKNGWIADYPVTPVVLGDLQKTVAAAADSHRLAMGKDEALRSLQAVADEFGLPVVVAGPGSSTTPYEQQNPEVINNYYYTYGPPVVTYYPPPPDYDYLYAWVPYPFWFGGFFFTGFFCLQDFDRIIVVDHVARICTNHVFDRRIGTIALVNPEGRGIERSFRHEAGFGSPRARRGGQTIFNRSLQRGRTRIAESGHSSRRFRRANRGLSGPGEPFQSQVPSGRHFGGPKMSMRDEGGGFGSHEQRRFGGVSSFSAPVAPERAPSMRFPSSGPGNEFHGGAISRGESSGEFHGRAFSHGGSFGGFRGGGFGHGGSFGGFHGGGFGHGGSFGGFHGGGFGHGGSR